MAIDTDNKKGRPRSRRSRRRPLQEQRFSSYLTFGVQTTICLVIFLLFYILVLAMLSPLLSEEAPQDSHMKRGQVLRPVVNPLIEKVKHMHHAPGQMIAEEVAGLMKKQYHSFRETQNITDEHLMKKVIGDIENIRSARFRKNQKQENDAIAAAAPAVKAAAPGTHNGFVVLGMHRSGTSMLSGLLAQGFGYNTGGPLIGSSFDNEKGFFERIDAVLQNDEFMNTQKVWWSNNVLNYKDEVALKDKEEGRITFKEGTKALGFLNNPENAPWLQKDPRMCITLRTWIKLINNEPAVLFTYRHPLEVAMSLKKREKNFTLEHGLRLWIAYNMRAIQNSAGLCTVYSSNKAILADTLAEVNRISDELTTKCGVPAPPRKITKEDVERFVDPKLQHNKKKDDDESMAIISESNGCTIREYSSSLPAGSAGYQREHDLYLKAMKIYCDFEVGAPYKEGYVWPEMT